MGKKEERKDRWEQREAEREGKMTGRREKGVREMA